MVRICGFCQSILRLLLPWEFELTAWVAYSMLIKVLFTDCHSCLCWLNSPFISARQQWLHAHQEPFLWNDNLNSSHFITRTLQILRNCWYNIPSPTLNFSLHSMQFVIWCLRVPLCTTGPVHCAAAFSNWTHWRLDRNTLTLWLRVPPLEKGNLFTFEIMQILTEEPLPLDLQTNANRQHCW